MLQPLFIILPFAAGLAVLGWGLYLMYAKKYPSYKKAIVTVKDHTFEASLADTMQKRAQGLSGIERIADNEAMLFTLPAARRRVFWMKGMRFPLDIIWIRDGAVVDVSESVAALPGIIVRPKAPANAVLEVNSGLVRKLGIKVGDKVEIAGSRQADKMRL